MQTSLHFASQFRSLEVILQPFRSLKIISQPKGKKEIFSQPISKLGDHFVAILKFGNYFATISKFGNHFSAIWKLGDHFSVKKVISQPMGDFAGGTLWLRNHFVAKRHFCSRGEISQPSAIFAAHFVAAKRGYSTAKWHSCAKGSFRSCENFRKGG